MFLFILRLNEARREEQTMFGEGSEGSNEQEELLDPEKIKETEEDEKMSTFSVNKTVASQEEGVPEDQRQGSVYFRSSVLSKVSKARSTHSSVDPE